MILLVHDYVPYEFKTFSELSGADTTLKKGLYLLEGITYPFWLACGSALGLYRDGDFCPDDNDIDVHIRVNHDIAKSLYADIRKIFSGWELVREMYFNNFPMQVCFRDKETGIPFDIIFMYDDIYVGSFTFINEHGEMVQPKFDTEYRDTKYGLLPFPSDIERYLTHHYRDWRTPKKIKGGFTHEY